MSRQTDRADARHASKMEASATRIAARVAARKAKGKTPLGKAEAAGYPQSKYRPVINQGKRYAPNGKQEVARRLRQMEAA